MVISRGKAVFEYGDVNQVSYLASCRKSVLAMLYGNYVASGKIQLNKTVGNSASTTSADFCPSRRRPPWNI